nr:hypothetical protein [Rhodococcus sp. 15-1154-1]
MTLFEMLPSLRNAGRPRFDSELWPSGTGFRDGRLMVDGVFVDDFADCEGTPARLGWVVVTRVRSVIAGIVRVDAVLGCVEVADIANRHSVVGRQFFAMGDAKVELPSDVRAGDLLAVIPEAQASVPGEA